MKFACRTRRGFTRYLNEKITVAGGFNRARPRTRIYVSIYTLYASLHILYIFSITIAGNERLAGYRLSLVVYHVKNGCFA